MVRYTKTDVRNRVNYLAQVTGIAAESILLYIESPGDGATRYHFGNHTAVGARDAMTYLDGFARMLHLQEVKTFN